MKKIIMAAIMLSTITVSAFATNTYGVNQKALKAFSSQHKHAEGIRWEVKENLYKVTFQSFGKEMYAYYNSDGEQLAITRNLSIDQLPLTLSSDLKSTFDSNWLTELFELSADGQTTYYATLESATHITTLKAEGGSGWTTFKKEKKK